MSEALLLLQLFSQLVLGLVLVFECWFSRCYSCCFLLSAGSGKDGGSDRSGGGGSDGSGDGDNTFSVETKQQGKASAVTANDTFEAIAEVAVYP